MNFNNELEHLNAQQLAAVVTDDVPLRIIAGAGSGKTRVLTMKIAYLINYQHLKSWRILAMTFTNKAAQEMKTRVQNLLADQENVNPFISTFHSFCYRVLREDYESVGLTKNFTIIDAGEQKILIKRIVKELNLSVQEYPNFEKQALFRIEKYKNEFMSASDVLNDESYLVRTEDRYIAQVYKEYEQVLKANGYVDFNDLQLKTYLLFKDNGTVLQKWVDRFDYILIDEFQDTNALQFELVKMLTNKRKCLTVVGDPDQTIYSWRGAQVDIILQFQKTFPTSKTIILDQNYRSTKQILDVANNAISFNNNREKKNLVTDTSGEKVVVFEAPTRYDEAAFVAKKIQEYVEQKKYDYRDFFVIYRINAWSQEFEKVFDNSKIPFNMVGGFRFRERKVIKDATAYLRAVSIKDNLALERVLHETPKVGQTTIDKLRNLSQEKDNSLYELLTEFSSEALAISKNLATLIELLKTGTKLVDDNNPAFDVLKFMLVESGFEERLKILSKTEDDEQNLQIFYEQLKAFDTNFDAETYQQPNHVLAFLQEEALGAEDEVNDDSPNKVTLMTIHAAKGLENKVVFLTGNSKGVFPSRRSAFNAKELEEERRAFYVALTRAEQELFISYVNGEYSYISQEEMSKSRFVKELNQDLYEFQANHFVDAINGTNSSSNTLRTSGQSDTSLTKKAEILSDIQSGDMVDHILFGEGIVIKRIGNQFRIAFTNPKYGVMLIEVNNPALSKK